MHKRIIKRVSLVVGAVFVTGALTGTALAVLGSAGGSQVRVDTRTETVANVSGVAAFSDLPGAAVTVSVPAGQSRLFSAGFSAESQCSGPGSGYCSVRIIATNVATGGLVELNPAAGLDYAFDSDEAGSGQDLWEGHAMDRSIRLPGGTYRIRVQRRVNVPGVTFRLDDWHLAVTQNL
jgi:hypothetical protein